MLKDWFASQNNYAGFNELTVIFLPDVVEPE